MKKHSLRLLAAAAFSTWLGLSTAHADVLDFEGDALTGSLLLAGDTVSLGAYTLTTRTGYGTIDSASSLGSQSPTGNATQFYFNGNDGAFSIARTDGSLFDLNGFAAAFVAQDPPSAQTTVLVAVGTRGDNSTVSAWWSFGSSTGSHSPFGTYSDASFSAFTGLKSVEFHACSLVGGAICTEALDNNGQFAMDAIALSATAVPEPASLGLFALGGLGLALVQRRKSRKQA